MKLDLEKYLKDNGVSLGTKVKICDFYFLVCKNKDDEIVLRNDNGILFNISLLLYSEFEIVKKERLCDKMCRAEVCEICPLRGLHCKLSKSGLVKDTFENTLKEYPILEPLREVLSKAIQKEI